MYMLNYINVYKPYYINSYIKMNYTNLQINKNCIGSYVNREGVIQGGIKNGR